MKQNENEKVNFLPHQAEVKGAVFKVLSQIGCEFKKDWKGREPQYYLLIYLKIITIFVL